MEKFLAISKKLKMELEKLDSTLTELNHVQGYVTELEQYSR